MSIENVAYVSLLGKFSPYQGELWTTPVNITELLSVKLKSRHKSLLALALFFRLFCH
ncbi:hypothetical protein JCM15765_24750 [Paradesulfitobacterium aromaticivorans]